MATDTGRKIHQIIVLVLGLAFGLSACVAAGTDDGATDPASQQAVIQQFGWDQIGLGTLTPNGRDGAMKMTQQFIDNSGNARSEGHTTTNPDAYSHVTTSFTIEDDKWAKQRSYAWVRQSDFWSSRGE